MRHLDHVHQTTENSFLFPDIIIAVFFINFRAHDDVRKEVSYAYTQTVYISHHHMLSCLVLYIQYAAIDQYVNKMSGLLQETGCLLLLVRVNLASIKNLFSWQSHNQKPSFFWVRMMVIEGKIY